MTIFNEILAARYSRFFARLFSMKGHTPVRQLAGEISAAMPLFNGVENRFLEGWNRWAASPAVAAVAAQNSAIRLRNPAGSNVMAVIERIDMSSNTAGAISFNLGPIATDLANADTAGRLDARQSTAFTLVATHGNNAGSFVNTILSDQVQASITLFIFSDENQELTLLPGDGLQLITSGVNVTLNASIWWRERALEESEFLK